VTTPEHDVILEPGDPGYVDPNAPSPATSGAIVAEPPPVPAGAEGAGAPAPPGQDLRPVPNPGETEAEYLDRTRGVPVESTSPTDIVPNRPQITFGPQEPVPPADQPETVSEARAEEQAEDEEE
jgi:hypothetical protein